MSTGYLHFFYVIFFWRSPGGERILHLNFHFIRPWSGLSECFKTFYNKLIWCYIAELKTEHHDKLTLRSPGGRRYPQVLASSFAARSTVPRWSFCCWKMALFRRFQSCQQHSRRKVWKCLPGICAGGRSRWSFIGVISGGRSMLVAAQKEAAKLHPNIGLLRSYFSHGVQYSREKLD